MHFNFEQHNSEMFWKKYNYRVVDKTNSTAGMTCITITTKTSWPHLKYY